MDMKRILLFAFIASFLVRTSAAQGIYFKLSGGYALPTATSTIGEKQTRTQTTVGNVNTDIITAKNVNASYGAGANFNAGVGYMFSKYISAELGVAYIAGKKYETSDLYFISGSNSTGSQQERTTYYSRAIYLNPAVTFTTGNTKLPYARFGFIFSSPKVYEEYSSYYDLDGTSERNRKGEYSKGTSVGFQGALGKNWPISNNIDIFVEVNVISITSYAKQYNITKSEYSNDHQAFQSDLDNIQTYYKKTIFDKETTTDNTKPIDPTQPQHQPRSGTAFSTIGLQIGVVYMLKGRIAE